MSIILAIYIIYYILYNILYIIYHIILYIYIIFNWIPNFTTIGLFIKSLVSGFSSSGTLLINGARSFLLLYIDFEGWFSKASDEGVLREGEKKREKTKGEQVF